MVLDHDLPATIDCVRSQINILFPARTLKGAERADKKKPTPKLDELEKGPWPSFVKEMKLSAETNAAAQALLGILERSYDEKIVHWKHGGIVGVKGYGGGIIGRDNDIPEDFPEIAEFHNLRLNQPAGGVYTPDAPPAR